MKPTANPIEIIRHKRDGHELTHHQIKFMIDEFVVGAVPNYQMSAFAMAIYFQGMTSDETASLTTAMLESGNRLHWPENTAIYSKHSTGGVGDKVSLILVPILAACDLKLPKLSGRGLGITGGTLDKLEAIPGFKTNLNIQQIQDAIESVGCCICSATDDIAPADKKLYALRDATATVPSIPLITSSILSKKLAENPRSLLLDVKCGAGAFMKKKEDAILLAQSLVKTGHQLGVPTECVLSDMSQPLGKSVGNLVEINEALEALSGNADSRLIELVLHMAEHCLQISNPGRQMCDIRSEVKAVLTNGRAKEKFLKMIEFQGGRLGSMKNESVTRTLAAADSGFVGSIDPEKIGWAVIEMGGGRKSTDQLLNHSVGCEILKQPGEQISRGEEWVKISCPDDQEQTSRAIDLISEAISIVSERPHPTSVIIQTVRI